MTKDTVTTAKVQRAARRDVRLARIERSRETDGPGVTTAWWSAAGIAA
jgi:hypothetical protein